MSIACIGITVLDRVQLVKQLPTAGGKYVAHNYFEVGGGPAATAAVAASKLGHAVDFIGRVGDDSVADTMLKELSSYGVGVEHTITIKGASSAFSAVIVDENGERMIINYQDESLSKDPSVLSEVDFSSYTTILADVRWVAGAKYALQKAREFGIPSVLDADIAPDNIDDLVELADHVAFSEPGLEKYSACSDPIEGLKIAQKKTKSKVYVTVGSKGCYWLDHDELCHQPGLKVDVVDTTGAGDVFHGALAVAIAEGMQTRDAILFSNTVAAVKCTKLGGREGIPNREEIDKVLAK